MLEIDSPGGEAAGCFDCADFIRDASAASGKPVWAHANEVACSGGYALASAASQIWVARTSEVGSIGVIGAHVDQSEADKKAGVKWTFIIAGEHKAEGNSHEPLNDGALARFQADVDHLMDMFVGTVAQNRGMTTQEIRDTKADIYRGALAVEAGLADEVGTFDEALEAFATHVDEMQTSGSGARVSKSKLKVELMAGKNSTTRGPKAEATEDDDKDKNVVAPAEDEEDEDGKNKPKTKDEDEGEGEGKKASAAAALNIGADAVKAETERCSALAALVPQAARLGVNFDLAAAIAGNVSVDAARAKIMDAAASGDAPETSAIAAPKQKAGGGKTHTAEDKRGMWKKAFKGR
ncbi:S49 family peptidase [Ensifer sp. LCM 4579]|uniref:S49 family peptidase n=1 Tax=Ensifer sp. LCM 4579 TaxID=1848292 RepID=UPI00155E900B|nr:S49 family peptidase [Ensifer sp. LCM 4579]